MRVRLLFPFIGREQEFGNIPLWKGPLPIDDSYMSQQYDDQLPAADAFELAISLPAMTLNTNTLKTDKRNFHCLLHQCSNIRGQRAGCPIFGQ